MVLDNSGTLIQKLSYDAWGLRRFPDGSEDPTSSISAPDSRGYTDHEHLPDSRLINMNARLYDPELGRFLSADPFIPDPLRSQAYNRYSYVYNNPLRYTDPSGYDPTEIIVVGQYQPRPPPGSSFTGDIPFWSLRPPYEFWEMEGQGAFVDGSSLNLAAQPTRDNIASTLADQGQTRRSLGVSQNPPTFEMDVIERRTGAAQRPRPFNRMDYPASERPSIWQRLNFFRDPKYQYENLKERFGNLCTGDNCNTGSLTPDVVKNISDLTIGTLGSIGMGKLMPAASGAAAAQVTPEMRRMGCVGALAACAAGATPYNARGVLIEGLYEGRTQFEKLDQIRRQIELDALIRAIE